MTQLLSNRIASTVVPTYLPGTTAGIVPATGLPGNTSGTSIPAGYVGELVIATSINLTSSAANTWTAGTNLTLSAGVWILFGSVNGTSQGSTGTYVSAYVSSTSTTSGNSITTVSLPGCTFGYDQVMSAMNATQGIGQAVIPGKVVYPTSSTVYYLGFGSDSTTTHQFVASLRAVRIA